MSAVERATLPGPGSAQLDDRFWKKFARAFKRVSAQMRATFDVTPQREQALEQFTSLKGANDGVLWERAGELLQRLATTYLAAQEVLPRPSLEVLKAMIEQALNGASQAAGQANGASQAAKGANATKQAKAILKACLDEVVARVDEQRKLSSRRRYARGLVSGVAFSVALLVLVSETAPMVVERFLDLLGPGSRRQGLDIGTYVALRDSLVCIGGGAAGAAVSVVLRLSRMPISNSGRGRYVAYLRIVLGWFFAMAVLALVKGDLVTVFIDPSKALVDGTATNAQWVTSWFMWAGIGFLAGFNERWATNLFTRDAEASEASEAKDHADSAPSAAQPRAGSLNGRSVSQRPRRP